MDFWISQWISGLQFGFLPTGFFLYVLGYSSFNVVHVDSNLHTTDSKESGFGFGGCTGSQIS